MESLYVIQDAVLDRLHDIADNIRESGDLHDSCIEMTDALTHTLKSVTTTIAMFGGYSRDSGYSGNNSYGGSSMEGGGYSERRGRSPITGRFVSRDGHPGYSGRPRYSRDSGEQDLMQELDQIMRDTSDNAVKQRIHSLKTKMQNGSGQ